MYIGSAELAEKNIYIKRIYEKKIQLYSENYI